MDSSKYILDPEDCDHGDGQALVSDWHYKGDYLDHAEGRCTHCNQEFVYCHVAEGMVRKGEEEQSHRKEPEYVNGLQ